MEGVPIHLSCLTSREAKSFLLTEDEGQAVLFRVLWRGCVKNLELGRGCEIGSLRQ